MSNLTTGKIVLLIVLILLSLYLIWSFFTHTYIRAEFNKMDPMPSRMGVYYKGYKLGTTRSEERRVGKGVDLGGRRIIKKSVFFKQKTAYEIFA